MAFSLDALNVSSSIFSKSVWKKLIMPSCGLSTSCSISSEGVQCPKSLVVTLCRDNRFGVQYAGQFMCQFVRPTDMTGQYRYDIFAGTVEADDCWVRVLALDVGGDAQYAPDTHRPDKHNRFRFIEKIAGRSLKEVNGSTSLSASLQ